MVRAVKNADGLLEVAAERNDLLLRVNDYMTSREIGTDTIVTSHYFEGDEVVGGGSGNFVELVPE